MAGDLLGKEGTRLELWNAAWRSVSVCSIPRVEQSSKLRAGSSLGGLVEEVIRELWRLFCNARLGCLLAEAKDAGNGVILTKMDLVS